MSQDFFSRRTVTFVSTKNYNLSVYFRTITTHEPNNICETIKVTIEASFGSPVMLLKTRQGAVLKLCK